MADNTVLPGSGETIADEEIGGVKFQQMKLIDSERGSLDPTGTNRHPLVVNDDSVALLRRIVKILENQQATDVAQRARITIDALTAGITFPVSQTTLANVTNITNAVGVGNIASLSGMDHKQFIEQSRIAYSGCIRSKLTFG